MALNLTTKAQETLQQAQAEAIRREHQEVTPEHLLYAMTSQVDSQDSVQDNLAVNILEIAGVQLKELKNRLEKELARLPRVSGGSGQVYASAHFNRLLVLAEDEAKKMGDEYISGEHFLLSLLSSQLKGIEGSRALQASGLTLDK